VRAEDHRLPPRLELDDRVLQRLRVDRVEPGEGLVEDHEVGLVQQRADELHLLLHAPRELVHLRQPPVALGRPELEPLEPFVDPLVGHARRYPLELREEPQHAPHLHLLVQPALLREVADPVGDPGCAVRRAEQRDRSAVRHDDVEQHPDRRRLPRAVRAEQAVHGSAGDGERQVAHGEVVAVALHDVPDVDGEVGHRGVKRSGRARRRHARGAARPC